jgi:hypothetical protein
MPDGSNELDGMGMSELLGNHPEPEYLGQQRETIAPVLWDGHIQTVPVCGDSRFAPIGRALRAAPLTPKVYAEFPELRYARRVKAERA